MFRYFIFLHQFVLLIVFFATQIPYYEMLICIFSIYLLASIIPIFSIADALIKGSIALTIFSFFGHNNPEILIIVFFMWISNVIIPALLGYMLLLKWQPKLWLQN